MDNQERNREALIRHIAEQDRIIRRRNEQISEQVERIEQAEGELDEYRAMHSEQIRTIARLQENPRALTPDAITDEMVDRAHRSLISHHGYGRILRSQVCEALTEALTEPPARPEGAEEIEAYMREIVASHPADHYGELADHVAARLADPTRKEA